ncbi:hypothetical protein [Tautonia sociabilis]|uniref:Uncharacterized protein n=1 Tax=Tautonia sociabilis TaxID=2080755 RepID=A0A432MIP1_9BACT|nr:hypothetical protein [Tautonia sociabilis]RUL87234.1 hypothetical protein TsocGM_13490 [Tautonia sociabilis]
MGAIMMTGAPVMDAFPATQGASSVPAVDYSVGATASPTAAGPTVQAEGIGTGVNTTTNQEAGRFGGAKAIGSVPINLGDQVAF